MSFLKRVKNDIYNEQKRMGLRNQCLVDAGALLELIDSYERLDSYIRAVKNNPANLRCKLQEVLCAMYCENHDSERLMLLIMEILKPMVERRVKEQDIDRRYIYPR